MKRKILLIGPMPPLIGGVSVHVSRLNIRVNDDPEFESAVFDLGRLNFYNSKGRKQNLLRGFVYFLSCSIVHIHISHPKKVFVAKFVKFFRKKIVYTQHNVHDEYSEATLNLHRLSTMAIKVYQPKLELKDAKTRCIPAYIPAKSSRKLQDSLVNEFAKYISVVAAICTHPSQKKVLVENKDIYGFDIILNAYSKIASSELLLVLLDPNGAMESVYDQVVKKLVRDGFNILYITDQVDFNSLLPYLKMYIRPTRSDGDSIAIRESMVAGVNVLASDCVLRPEGVCLFESENEESFVEQFANCIGKRAEYHLAEVDYAGQIIDVYRSI